MIKGPQFIQKPSEQSSIPINYVTIDPEAGAPSAPIKIPQGLSYLIFDLNHDDYVFAGSPFVRKGSKPMPAFIEVQPFGQKRVAVQFVNFSPASQREKYSFNIYVINEAKDPNGLVTIDPQVEFEEDTATGEGG